MTRFDSLIIITGRTPNPYQDSYGMEVFVDNVIDEIMEPPYTYGQYADQNLVPGHFCQESLVLRENFPLIHMKRKVALKSL